MSHFISLSSVPSWARLELADAIAEKINKEGIEAKVDDYQDTHFDFPAELLIQGTAVALAGLMPFIKDWLDRKRITCEIQEEGGKTTITVTGSDVSRVLEVKKMIQNLDDEHK